MSRRRKIAIGVTAVLVVALAAPFAWLQWFGPERFDGLDLGRMPESAIEGAGEDAQAEGDDEPDVQVPTAPRGLETFLLFSVGAAGMSEADAERIGIADVDERDTDDNLTDTIILLVSDADTGRVAMLSIPRDTWVFERGRRINATFKDHGPQAFIDDVSELTGMPVDHLIQVNFVAFSDLVDAVGGVALEVDRPLADVFAGLYVPEPGCWRFDGPEALAFARSRMTLTVEDGFWRRDASANDIARTERQQRLLGELWDQMRGPSLVTRLPDLLTASRGLKYDDALGLGDAMQLARIFGDVSAGNVEGYTLPTVDQTISGAAAQVVDEAEAPPILRRLRNWPPALLDGDETIGEEANAGETAGGGAAAQETVDGAGATGEDGSGTDAADSTATATPSAGTAEPDCTLDAAEDLPPSVDGLTPIWRAERDGGRAPAPDA